MQVLYNPLKVGFINVQWFSHGLVDKNDTCENKTLFKDQFKSMKEWRKCQYFCHKVKCFLNVFRGDFSCGREKCLGEAFPY